MKIGLYVFASLAYIALLGAFAYTLELGNYRLDLLNITLPISIWIILPALLLFVFTVGHMLFYGLKNYLLLKKWRKDTKKLEDGLYWSLVNEPKEQKYAIDEDNNQYFIMIDSQIAQLFGNQEFSLFDWKRRLQLKYALAKSLQRHIAASSQTMQRFTYVDLLRRFKRENSNIKYLKRDLKRACQELVDVKILFNYSLDDKAVKIYKNKNIPG